MLRRRVVTELLGPKGASGTLALTIITFGFKNGPPREVDVVLDVRFLPNPHYREDLRPLTGLDPKVVEYVEAGDLAREFYARLFDWKMEPYNYVTIYVQVDDLDAYLERAGKLGGKTLVPPTEVPGMGRFAWLADPEGTIVGLWKPAHA